MISKSVVFSLALGLMFLTLGGCAKSAGNEKMLLELRAAIVYEKPLIESVSHRLEDGRADGGLVVARVTVLGDPGLAATFDITPDVTALQSMSEREAGVYVGEFAFPEGKIGGPFTVIGRLSHDAAGEVVLRDPQAMIVTRPPRRR